MSRCPEPGKREVADDEDDQRAREAAQLMGAKLAQGRSDERLAEGAVEDHQNRDSEPDREDPSPGNTVVY